MPSSYLFLNGLRLHYLYWNLEGKGRPVVLLHGLASNARIWEWVAPFLSEQGLTSYAPDLRGHGLSDKPDGDYSFETFRNDLRAILDGLNCERPVLVGHSWGALLALDYAARFQVGPRAPAGIVLVDGGLTQLDQSYGTDWEQVRGQLAPPALTGMPQEEFLAHYAGRNHAWDPENSAAQIILANFEVDEQETIQPRLTYERHMRILRSIWEFQTFERLERLGCPVAAVLAEPPKPRSAFEADHLATVLQSVDRACMMKSGLQVHWLEGTGQDTPLQRPAELGSLIGGFTRGLS